MAAWKVVHVITRLDGGGSAQNTLLTALGHDRSRFEPLVVAGLSGRWDAQGGDQATEENRRRLEGAGVRCHLMPTLTREVNPLKDPMALGQLIGLLGRERPPIVHTHTSKAGVLGRLAARLAGVPVVVHTPHGHVFYGHFGRLKSSHPRLHAIIVGSGGLRAELAALATRLGVGDAVQFLGERRDVPDCLAAMDLFVLPSLNEGMGRALIEAMAAGRPVIATRVGGVPAIVEDRRTGLLVPPGDSTALAAAILELLRHPGWAKELGAAASERIGARFGVPAMVQGVEAVYAAALQEERMR